MAGRNRMMLVLQIGYEIMYYNQMQEGLRNTITCSSINQWSNCEHLFVLKRLQDASANMEVRVDFSPASRSNQSQQPPICQYYSTLPAFNKDHKFYTPSFMVEQDQAKLNLHNSSFLTNHTKKIQELVEETDELLVPKPSKANRFCLICKESYEDYLTHISFPSHNRLLKSSPFCNDIRELCSRMNPLGLTIPKKKIIKERKKKQTCKTSSKNKSVGIQKSSECLSTALQSLQIGQLQAIK